MKAKVQYNDFVGTAAADISDHTNLTIFLQSRGVDMERYNAIGAKFYSGERGFFSASIICIDKNCGEGENPIIEITFESDISRDEFFSLFKRFSVIITQEDFNSQEIRDAITIDDRGGEE